MPALNTINAHRHASSDFWVSRAPGRKTAIFKEIAFPRLDWLIRYRHHLFAKRCTAHIRAEKVRSHVRSEILRTVRQKFDAGVTLDLDPRFHLWIDEQDLAEKRMEFILDRFNRLLYCDDIRFAPGLERELVSSHQHAGRGFQWKMLPRRAPIAIRLIDTTVGFGVFAERDLAAGDFIGEYAGLVMPSNSIVDTTYSYRYFSLQDGDEETIFSIDAMTMGNETRFINHTESEAVSHTDEFYNGHNHILFTVCDPIAKGEQLLINYGSRYWEGGRTPPVSL